MTLFDLLSTLKTNSKVTIIRGEESFTVYADSVKALDESIQDAIVFEWEIKNTKIEVTLESDVPSA